MKRSASKADLLEQKANEIDTFPFEELPTDLIYKIFMESEFTVKELHMLCNLSKKLKEVCNKRKFWDELFFRKIMNMELPMNVAKRNNTLPELMETLRATDEYKLWTSITEYEQFVKFIAFALTGVFKRQIGTGMEIELYNRNLSWILQITVKEESGYVIKFYKFDEVGKRASVHETMYTYVKNFQFKVQFLWDRIKVEIYDTKTYMLFFCKLINVGFQFEKDYNKLSALNNVPLLKCAICYSITDLQKCSCPCNAIFCSTKCQSKTH